MEAGDDSFFKNYDLLSEKDLIPNFSKYQICRKKSDGSIYYFLHEPILSDSSRFILEKMKKNALEGRSIGNPSMEIDSQIEAMAKNMNLTMDTQQKRYIAYYFGRDLFGMERIESLLRDGDIEDISCDRAGLGIYIYHRKYGYIPTNIMFEDEIELSRFVKMMSQKSGKSLSLSTPVIDANLPDGSRLQASLGQEVTTNGSSFTIRKFRSVPFSPIDLISTWTTSSRIFAYLWILSEYGSNIVVVGGTATGKTTFLNSILLFIPPEKKIITIEDTKELNLFHENWVSTVTRPGYGMPGPDGKVEGEIDMFDLLTISLRQRPNYIVLGEVRGREAFTVFQAMSVGRYGYTTFHADDVNTFVHRLEAKPINIPRNLIISIDAIVLLEAFQGKSGTERRVKSISEIKEIDPLTNDLIINEVYSFNGNGYDTSGFSYILKRIAEKEGKTEAEMEHELLLREKILSKLQEKHTYDFREVGRIIKRFYKARESVLHDLGIEI
ncbi:type II/IV secretion system ATPase subunit [Oxyplasma meridianum]|uniref:Type II/IV secretion system ATPase subunit n=1 Tax=Oxyplasma meridianum TaxID=3073602 RepID=A0AAX4NHR6_9ARCH